MGPGYQQRLTDYLKSVQTRDFQWHTWDCLQFTNEAWRAMHGTGWADDWLGRYTAGGKYMRADELRAEFGFETIQDAIASKLSPLSGVPPRGALVATDHESFLVIGVALGVAIGHRAAFVGKGGVITLPIDQISGAWA